MSSSPQLPYSRSLWVCGATFLQVPLHPISSSLSVGLCRFAWQKYKIPPSTLLSGFMSSLFKKIEKIWSSRSKVSHRASLQREVKMIQKLRGKRFPTLKQLFHIRRVLTKTEYGVLLGSFLVFCASFVWFGIALAGSYRIAVPKVGGTYREGIVGTPQLINPLFSNLNDVDNDLTRLIYSGLMRYDKDQRLVPDIASRFEVSEDKKTYTFFLKDGVKWQDGEPVISEDVQFTIDTILDTKVGSPARVSFQGVHAQAIDDKQIVFTLDEPFPSFLSSLTIGILPQHIWGSISPEAMRLAQGNLKPVGSGPFKFKRLIKDSNGVVSRVELVRSENFYRDPAYVSEIDFVFYSDYEGQEGAIQALRQNEIDGLNFVPFNLREKVKRKHTELKTLQLPQYSALFMNQNNNEFLKDKDIRVALSRGLDRDRILHETLSSEGAVIYSPILSGFPGFDESFKPYPYSVQSANMLIDKNWPRIDAETYKKELKEKLLKDRGVELIASSTADMNEETKKKLEEIDKEIQDQVNDAQLFYRKNKAGQVLQFGIVTADTNEYRKAAQMVAGAWQELGVITRITYIPTKDIAREVLRKRDYDILLYSVIIGNDPDQYPFWHSSQVDYPGLNLSQYVNRGIDEKLQKIRDTDNSEEQEKLYKEFQSALLEDIPAIFLYSPTYTYVLTDTVKGFAVGHISHPSDRFSNVTDWYIKTKHIWNF